MGDPLASMRAAELGRMRADFQRWSSAASGTGGLDDDRRAAIRTVMEAHLERADLRLAERTWTLFRHVLAQRASLDTGQLLERADACATDMYLAFAPAGSPLAPPIVCVDPIETPATAVRSPPHRREAREIPIPVVFIPPGYLSCPWLLTTIHHEVGHALDRDLGVTEALLPIVDIVLGAEAPTGPTWKRWLREIVCDAFALRASGPAFAWTLALIHDRLDLWASWDDGGPHPPAAIRMPMLAALLRATGVQHRTLGTLATLDALTRARSGPIDSLRTPFLDTMNAVAGLVMNAGIRDLGPLADAGPSAEADLEAIAAAAAKLGGGGAGGAADDLPIRLVPAAAQIAMLDADPAAHEQLATATLDRLTTARARPWVASDATWTALRERAHTMTATVLAGKEQLKVPPVELLVRHDRVSFVGATNHQLSLELARAAAADAGGGKRWRRIEIFFLSDVGLATLAASVGDAAELVARKREARYALAGQMVHADSWAFYEYDRPFYFASYWDAEAERGRIHVSPYVWGEDLVTCPAVDYLRGRTPTAAYLAYERGLGALRRAARLLEGAPPPNV